MADSDARRLRLIAASPLDDTWLRPAKVAEMLDVSSTTIYRLCAADELRWIRVGGQIRISEIGLANWIAEGGNDEHAAKDWPMTPRLVVGL